MRSRKATIFIYYLILNFIIFLVFLTLLNTFINSNITLLYSFVLTSIINVILFSNVEKILLFKYVSRKTKSYKSLITKINNQCVIHNINKIKIYSSRLLHNKCIFIKKRKRDSLLIISEDALTELNNINKFETIFNVIHRSTLITTLFASVNNMIFFILIYPLIFIHQRWNLKFFEYLLIMLSNIHFSTNSTAKNSCNSFELYAKKQIIDQIILTNIEHSIDNID